MIIGLGYEARIGKDSAADYLVNKYGCVKLSFAQPLKEAVKITHGYSDEQVYGSLKEVVDPFWGETPRQTLQKIGTDCLRTHYRGDIWIRATMRKVEELTKQGKDIVIADVRFCNEASAIKEAGGFVVRVDASFEGREIIKTNQHISEVEMANYDGWNYIINNNTTLHDYFNKVDLAYRILKTM